MRTRVFEKSLFYFSSPGWRKLPELPKLRLAAMRLSRELFRKAANVAMMGRLMPFIAFTISLMILRTLVRLYEL